MDMATLAVGVAVVLGLPVLMPTSAPRAQGTTDPDPDTKLLYTNRAYQVLPKAPDTPALYFTYKILDTGKFVQRRGQFLFDDGDDRWQLESDPEALRLFWPLRP